MAKSNSKNHKNKGHSNSSKLFIGVVVAVLLVLAISTYGTQLTGYQVASMQVPDSLTVRPIGLASVRINSDSTSCSFSTIKLTSNLPGAFRFGSIQTNEVWWIVKNTTRTAGCSNFNGYWVYRNSSGSLLNYSEYSPGSWIGSSRGIITTIRYHYNINAEVISTITMMADGSFARFSGATTGNTTAVNVSIRDGSPQTTTGHWKITAVYGNSAMGSPRATTAYFRDTIGSTASGQVGYKYRNDTTIFTNVPFCSPRGSCLNTSTRTLIRVLVPRN